MVPQPTFKLDQFQVLISQPLVLGNLWFPSQYAKQPKNLETFNFLFDEKITNDGKFQIQMNFFFTGKLKHYILQDPKF